MEELLEKRRKMEATQRLLTGIGYYVKRAYADGTLRVTFDEHHLGNDGHHMVHVETPKMQCSIESTLWRKNFNRYFAL